MADRFVRDVRDCVTKIMKEPKAKCGGQVCRTSSLVMLITVRNSSCGKVMFSQASVSLSVDKGGHVWQGSMLGGLHGRGVCVAGETATAADGTHPTGMHSCSCFLSSKALRSL